MKKSKKKITIKKSPLLKKNSSTATCSAYPLKEEDIVLVPFAKVFSNVEKAKLIDEILEDLPTCVQNNCAGCSWTDSQGHLCIAYKVVTMVIHAHIVELKHKILKEC